MGKLCGVTMIKNAVKFDYCIKEAIESMLGVCDYVICAYVESEDDTLDILESISKDKFKILHLTASDWNFYEDKHRLSYITNIAIQEADRMGFEYVLYIQGDEIVHEKSYADIRQAVQNGAESYFCKRINLWESPYLQLDVTHERKPCSTEIVRLAKTRYRSVDDAESIGTPLPDTYFLNGIHIWHYGFIRKKEVMKSKIINMQEAVFGVDHDKKLDQCEVFDSKLWFDGDDLKPIDYPHPKIMKEWIKKRP